jgi:cytochrome b561
MTAEADTEAPSMPVRRYHPVLVALHWLLGLLIVMQLAGGYFGIAKIPNTDPAKLDALKIHMLAGTLVLVLMVARFAVRYFTSHPEPTASQRVGIGRLRGPVHLALYLAVLLTAGLGWTTGYLISGVYATPGATLPADFAHYPTRVAHAWSALALFLLIVLHIAAAIREGLGGEHDIMFRIWFGKRGD